MPDDKIEKQTRFGRPQILAFMGGKPAEDVSRMPTEQAIDYLSALKGTYYELLDAGERLEVDEGQREPVHSGFLESTVWYFPGLFKVLMHYGHSADAIKHTLLTSEMPPEMDEDMRRQMRLDVEDAYLHSVRPH